MWLKRSGWQCIQSRKKSHCSNGDGREPGCFNIVYSQMCSTHKKKKKVLWNFLLISSKNISLFTSLGSDSRSQAHKTFVRFFFFWQKFEKVCKILWNSGRCCTSSEGNCSFFFLFFFFGVLECERPEGADVEKMTFTSMSRDRRQRCTLNAYCFFALKTFPLPARSCPDPAPTETFVQNPRDQVELFIFSCVGEWDRENRTNTAGTKADKVPILLIVRTRRRHLFLQFIA